MKTGITATACVTGFESCLKACAPGSYGFKQAVSTAGKYTEVGACGLPTDATIAAICLHQRGRGTTTVTNNTPAPQSGPGRTTAPENTVCATEAGVLPGVIGWFVWDCQNQWWCRGLAGA